MNIVEVYIIMFKTIAKMGAGFVSYLAVLITIMLFIGTLIKLRKNKLKYL